jgi:hypothetical protein
VFAIPMIWFEGEFVFYLVYNISCILLLFCCISFIFTEVNFASPFILACMWLIMLIIVLG